MRGFRELDRILRGDATAANDLQRDGLGGSLVPLIGANVLLAAFYGICMGIFGLFGRGEPDYRFLVADAVKVPLLFFLTACVTFPSLYVFNTLVGSSLKLFDLVRLITASLGVMLAVLAGFGPIVAFFSITTTSYPFIVLLNVAVFTVAGGFGIAFLLRTIEKWTLIPITPRAAAVRTEDAPAPVSSTTPNSEPNGEPGQEGEMPVAQLRESSRKELPQRRMVEVVAPPTGDPRVRVVFRVWLVAFALVGAQMSWVLRPFIGTPASDFTWLRPRQSSFFEAVMKSLRMLFS